MCDDAFPEKAGKDALRRLSILEHALGIDEKDMLLCKGEFGKKDCDHCTPETCPVVNNLLQETMQSVLDLQRRIEVLEILVEASQDSPELHRKAVIEQQRRKMLRDIESLEAVLSEIGPREEFLEVLARKRERLAILDGMLVEAKDG